MYIIVGGTGHLGAYLIEAIISKTNEDILAVGRSAPVDRGARCQFFECNVCKKGDMDRLICEINSKKELCKIIYLSACHNPEAVENDIYMSWNTNVIPLNYFVKSLHNDPIIIFASSDAVYRDSKDQYRYKENDTVDPVSMYGIQKAVGEYIVCHYGQHAFRYSLLMGHSLVKERKHFYDVIMERLDKGETIDLFTDAVRCMLDFKSAADLTIDLIEQYAQDLPPILNISGDDALSKYDIGMMMAHKYNKKKELIIPISLEKSRDIFKIKRATTILTDNSLLKSLLKIEQIQIEL